MSGGLRERRRTTSTIDSATAVGVPQEVRDLIESARHVVHLRVNFGAQMSIARANAEKGGWVR